MKRFTNIRGLYKLSRLIIGLIIIVAIINSTAIKNKVQGLTGNTVQTETQVYSSNSYHCDGRVYCSSMTSCEEAKFFLNNCPNVKMDGNHDGVPCESQWCN
jgi:hypothetical protein